MPEFLALNSLGIISSIPTQDAGVNSGSNSMVISVSKSDISLSAVKSPLRTILSEIINSLFS
ncbi:MAG: hypothetical protein VW298_02340 [Candidatus Woesearchaeota archaeon]